MTFPVCSDRGRRRPATRRAKPVLRYLPALSAALLGVLLIPVCFVALRRLMGDKLDEKKAIELTAGGYAEAPAKMNHYGWVSSPSVVQIQGQGPFGITYVNPADDPSKQ